MRLRNRRTNDIMLPCASQHPRGRSEPAIVVESRREFLRVSALKHEKEVGSIGSKAFRYRLDFRVGDVGRIRRIRHHQSREMPAEPQQPPKAVLERSNANMGLFQHRGKILCVGSPHSVECALRFHCVHHGRVLRFDNINLKVNLRTISCRGTSERNKMGRRCCEGNNSRAFDDT